jgi:aarF domain-containing kinase
MCSTVSDSQGGQYVAANNHVVPAEYIDTLKVLQDQVPNRPFEDMERIFVEDLGHPLEYL